MVRYIYKLFNKTAGFLSTLLAIPSMMYIEIHPSPHSLGTILTLFLLLFLVSQVSTKNKALSLVLILVLILSHPLSPVILLLFVLAQYFSSLVTRNKIAFPFSTITLIAIAAFSYAIYQATAMGQEIFSAIGNVASLQFFKNLTPAVAQPTSFIYQDVSNLRLFTYGVYLMLALIFTLQIPLNLYLKRAGRTLYQTIQTLEKNRLFFLILIFLLIIASLTTSLAMGWTATKESYLIYIMFSVATLIGSIISMKKRPKYVFGIVLSCLVVVTLAFPLSSYGMDATLSYPVSEKDGMYFVTSNADLQKQNISMWRPERLAICMQPNVIFHVVTFPPSENSSAASMVLLLKSAYFEIAMRRDLSFTDNHYTKYDNYVEASTSFNKIYSSPSVEVFVKTT